MSKIVKCIIATATLCTFCVPMISTPVTAMTEENREFIRGTGYTPDFEETTLYSSQLNSGIAVSEYESQEVFSSIDLSTSPFFPEIGNQGTTNSCTSWAATYYQFTYEANKANGIVTTDENAYSPSWTYNFVNKGQNTPSDFGNVYNVLRRQGALRMEDCPFDAENYDFSWSTNTEAMIEALNTKAKNSGSNLLTVVTTNTTQIESFSDSLLTNIKQYLCAGKVLTVAVDCGSSTANGMSNWSTKQTRNGEWAVYRAASASIGHALTIVGYNDNIWCDINNNNSYESNERGAFKVVNSWGTDWANDGYIWIMYDALNTVSVVDGTWESSLSGTRTPIFDGDGSGINKFWYVDIEDRSDKPVNLVALLTVTTQNRYGMNLANARSATTSISNGSYNFPVTNTYSITPAPYTGTLALDFGSLDDTVNYLSSYNWFVRIWNREGCENVTNVTYKIVDNKNNLVKNAGRIATSIAPVATTTAFSEYISLNLQPGDVNYDESLSAVDAQRILDYSAGNIEFSDLQLTLGDYNQDKAVNAKDASAVYGALSSSEAAIFETYLINEYETLQSSSNLMSTDTTAFQSARYAEVITELYESIILGK